MKIRIALLLSLLWLIAPRAGAAEGAYWALGGGKLTFDDSVDSIEPTQLVGRFGYNFNDYFGLGLESGFSLVEDELFGIDYDVGTLFLFLRVSLPLGDDLSLYALFGSTDVDLTGSAFGVSVTSSDDDTGTGFGIEIGGDRFAFFVDTVTYFDDSDVLVDAVNFGIAGYF